MITVIYPRKPWPTDAVMVVASAWEERTPGLPGLPHRCRECGRRVAVHPATIKHAADLGRLHRRPTKCFCADCAMGYNPQGVEVIDMRKEGRQP